MSYSISLNNFKKVAAAAIFIATAVSLFPESAQAGLAKGDGKSGNGTNFSFNLNLDQTKNNEGFFPEAIQEFKATGSFETSELCGKQEGTSCSGNMTVTRLKEEPNGKITGLDFGLSDLNKILDQGIFDPKFKLNIFSKNVLRYDVTLDSDPDSELIWFIESNDSNLLNDLSGLSRFKGALGIFPDDLNFTKDDGEFTLRGGGVFEMSLQSVPEPTSTASLLGIGTLGAVSLLKRKQPLKKTNGLNQ